MARAARREPYLYRLEEDRSLAPELQTLFSIRLKTGHDHNLTSSRYANTVTTGDKGKMELDVLLSNTADKLEFQHLVQEVTNFDFGAEYYEKYPAMAEQATERSYEDREETKGLFVASVTEVSQLADIARLLPNKDLREILNAANDRSILEDGEKK